GPPATPKGRRGGAAVGEITTPTREDVLGEWRRIETLLPPGFQERILIPGGDGLARDIIGPDAVRAFAGLLGVPARGEPPEEPPTDRRTSFDPDARQHRQVAELQGHVQRLLRTADATRNAFFLDRTTLIRTLAPRGERFRMFRV